ncbi:hypothetical protein GXP67_33950 [Rhodocytophaga rosea]|uniref:Universal stress protein n=1 Tax=Rhodocytophaga rosea TaxID=2704465 RepID=A0A6C0GTF4_9BACT|nr:hypothetical protein [Rhodocytophaga rosea]QHT71306.1 hypothetical protein GXP67_33950 [Rhodocytophaga rosea]
MKTTICTTDSSQAAANAVTYATTFCEAMQSELAFMYKQSVTSLFTHPQQVQMAGLGTIHAADAQRADIEYSYQIDPENQIQHISGIAHAARMEQADLITTGVDKEFGYNDVYNQLVSNLITQAKCPALFIPEGVTFKPLKKIVLVIDHEFNITHRLAFIASLARISGAEILFLQINTGRNWVTEHPFYTSSIDMYLAFPYPHTSFYEVVHECIPEAIRNFAEKVQADLVITVPNQPDQLPYTPATSVHYDEYNAHRLTIPLLALDTQPKQTVNMTGYPFN